MGHYTLIKTFTVTKKDKDKTKQDYTIKNVQINMIKIYLNH